MNSFAKTASRLRTSLFLSLALVALLAACATTPPPPNDALTAARSAITSAEQGDARQHASAELQEAQQQLTMAERALAAEDMMAAEHLANQARIAAVLAMARTESAKALEINREMERSSDALDAEIHRQGDQ